MHRGYKIAVAIPAFNEEKLIGRTIAELPDFIDHIVVTNDASTDRTLEVLNQLQENDKRLTVFTNERNRGVGFSQIQNFKEAVAQGADFVCAIPGDAQFDSSLLQKYCDIAIDQKIDFVKGNRFSNLDALRQMPTYRRIGNVVVTVLNKFATGYYSIFDSQHGCGVFSRSVLERMPYELVGERYDFENTTLIAMAIIGGTVKDVPSRAIYGEETSTIKLGRTVARALWVLFVGFWRRIYYKYILIDFHPIALFLLSGLLLTGLGTGYGLYLGISRIVSGVSPTTGTVMLSVASFLAGFQFLLTAAIMDVNNERRP
jgi:glycosyltransferase involved in cell wall biosynthesis